MAQLQRRADRGGLLRGGRQLPVRHLGARVHEPGGPARARVRRSGAAADARPGADGRHHPRRRLVDVLAQRLHLRVRHQARPRLVGAEPAHHWHRRRLGGGGREQLRHFKTFGLSNPQTQIGSYQQNPGATIAVRSPVEGQGVQGGTPRSSRTSTAPTTRPSVSCVGTVADGSPVDTATLGNKVFRVTATDSDGTCTIKDVPYMVNSVDYTIAFPTANVDTTLSLTMPTTLALVRHVAARRGEGVPGVGRVQRDLDGGQRRDHDPRRGRRPPPAGS